VAFDFDAAIRWARFESGKTLIRRGDDELPLLDATAAAGPELLLDTNVYIDGLQGRAPDVVAELLIVRKANHSTVALQELMHSVGALDSSHPGTRGAIKQIAVIVKSIPTHRLFTPDADTLGRAALLSGILCRRQGYGSAERFRALQDCTLFLQAQKLGFTALSANLRDFDCLLQLIPAARVLLYRPTVASR
jgi:hypothetical protein